MSKFKNTQGITDISYEVNVRPFCPLGNDYYDANVKVILSPGGTIMDYCDETKFMDSFNSKSVIIEDLLKEVYEHVMEEYEPTFARVEVTAKSAVHLPVVVGKEGTYDDYRF